MGKTDCTRLIKLAEEVARVDTILLENELFQSRAEINEYRIKFQDKISKKHGIHIKMIHFYIVLDHIINETPRIKQVKFEALFNHLEKQLVKMKEE